MIKLLPWLVHTFYICTPINYINFTGIDPYAVPIFRMQYCEVSVQTPYKYEDEFEIDLDKKK